MAIDRVLSQLKAFREEDEARWRYEAEQVKRQNQIFAKFGRTDEEMKSVMEEGGINVHAFEKESAETVKRLKKAHKELLNIDPPPVRSFPQTQAELNFISTFGAENYWTNRRCDWFYPPVQDARGSNSERCGFNIDLGEINIAGSSTGDGLGWAARAYSWQYCTLWYVFFPPVAGDITVEPHVDFQGNVAISAHDHLYTSTHAELKVELRYDLYQHYWDGEQIATIIDEDRSDSSTAYWVDHHRVMSKSLSVSAHDPVYIKLTVAYFVKAHSSHATVEYNFREGASRRIRLERIKICRPVPLRVFLPSR
ncbi:MAG: hypothetical protein P8Z00_10100 [Anaerolineales bacterium]